MKGPFLEKLPRKMEDMKDLKALGYTSPREAIAEKFHMSETLLAALNPGKKFDEAGQMISVANVTTKEEKPAVARVEVDKTAQTVKAFGNAGELIAFFPASIGSEEKPTPSGALKVTSIDANPHYRYNPAYKFRGVRAKRPSPSSPAPTTPSAPSGSGFRRRDMAFTAPPIRPRSASRNRTAACALPIGMPTGWRGF